MTVPSTFPCGAQGVCTALWIRECSSPQVGQQMPPKLALCPWHCLLAFAHLPLPRPVPASPLLPGPGLAPLSQQPGLLVGTDVHCLFGWMRGCHCVQVLSVLLFAGHMPCFFGSILVSLGPWLLGVLKSACHLEEKPCWVWTRIALDQRASKDGQVTKSST